MDSSSGFSSSIWEEIELSERYLVHCMFEEAGKLSSSIIHRLRNSTSSDGIDDIELADVMESAGMVFIQSIQSMERIQELFIELKELFGSVAYIPVRVFLTGACMILTKHPSSNLKVIFDEFLMKWKYDGEVYTLVEEEQDSSCIMQLYITVEQYVEVAEVYAITLLGMALKNPNLASSWAEKATLPEESRQNILSRLRALSRLADSSLSSGLRPADDKALEAINISAHVTSLTTSGNGSYKKDAKSAILSNGNLEKENLLKPHHPNIQRIKNQIEPCFWWYRTVHMKYGNIQLVLSRGNLMIVVSLIILALYLLRNKTAILKRFATKQVSALKRALVDAWQLAFSVQVNPLAAIQQVPSAPHGSI